MRCRTRAVKTAIALFAVLLLMDSCPQSGGTELPINFIEDRTAKLVGEAAVRVVCYIDTEQYSPLNALDYTLGENGPPYFDYVTVGAAGLKKDSKGVYIDLPTDLHQVLENRFSYIVPLQKRGIKVLLGITGARDGLSFGTVSDDERKVLALSIVKILDLYCLDGVELDDANAARSPLPGDFPYPEGDFVAGDGTITHVSANTPEEAQMAWLAGGDRMTDLIWTIREEINASLEKAEADRQDSMIDSLQIKMIIVREENYGKYLREDVPGGYFISRDDQLNFVVNPRFNRFGSESAANPEESVLFNLKRTQYGPLAIDLGGDPVSGEVVPPRVDPSGNNQDIRAFSQKFAEIGNYGIIFYQNLKPVSLANTDQAEYMSITSQAVFGGEVVCRSGGGDYLQGWKQ